MLTSLYNKKYKNELIKALCNNNSIKFKNALQIINKNNKLKLNYEEINNLSILA